MKNYPVQGSLRVIATSNEPRFPRKKWLMVNSVKSRMAGLALGKLEDALSKPVSEKMFEALSCESNLQWHDLREKD